MKVKTDATRFHHLLLFLLLRENADDGAAENDKVTNKARALLAKINMIVRGPAGCGPIPLPTKAAPIPISQFDSTFTDQQKYCHLLPPPINLL